VFIKRNQYWFLAALVLLALALNLGLMPLGEHYDLFLFQSWGNRALQEGLPSLYQDKLEKDFNQETSNHPPLHLYLLRFDAWLNFRLFQDNTPLTPHYLVISKLIACLSNITIGLLIYFYIRFQRGLKMAFLVTAIYLLNPALIYDISYWGQADAIGTLFMLLSILLLMKNRPLGSTVCLSLGVLIQLRAIILLPVLFLVIIKKERIRKILVIVIINILLIAGVCLPYLRAHQAENLLRVVIDSPGTFSYVTCAAANFWYLISPHYPIDEVLKDTIPIFGVSLRMVGSTLFILYILLVLYHLHKNGDVLLASAAICFAFFMLPTQIHSRYLFPFFALLALSLTKNKKFFYIFIILSLSYLLNLMMVLQFPWRQYYIYYFIQSTLNRLIERYSFERVLLFLSVINFMIFIAFSYMVLGQRLRHYLQNDFGRMKELFLKYLSN